MKFSQSDNVLTISITSNFEQMVAYLYLLTLEFVSEGIFVPSLNPPMDNNFAPAPYFFNVQHQICYKKKASFLVKDNTVLLSFDTINDATAFREDLERTW